MIISAFTLQDDYSFHSPGKVAAGRVICER